METMVRVGLIGANPNGGWARESHVPAIQALPGLELAALAGKTQAAADAASRAFGVAKAYGDVADLFRDEEIDLVTIAVTLPAHRELLLPALRAGKHVYCEYPLGLDVEESKNLEEAARSAGVHAAIGLQMRANPAVRRARELLSDGAIGRVLTARIVSSTAGFGPHVEPADAYTEDPANGVTVLTIQAAHTIDLAIAFLGPIESLLAMASRQFPEIQIGDGKLQARQIYDHVLVQARLSSGVPLAVEVAGGRPETPFRFEIVGEHGRLSLQGGAPRGFQSGRLTLSIDGKAQPVDEADLSSVADPVLNVAATYAGLRDDIARGTRTSTGFEHAVRLASLIDDVAAASQVGQRKLPGNWPMS